MVEIGGDGGGGGGGGPLHVSVDRSPMHSRNGSRCAHAYLLSHRGATRWLTEHPKLINHIDHHFDAMHYKVRCLREYCILLLSLAALTRAAQPYP